LTSRRGKLTRIIMAKILLIEDDALLARTIGNYLTKAGYELYVAIDIDQAWEALRVQQIDLIFLDIMLPKVDGLAILEKLKSNSEYQAIPTIMLTNLGESETMDRAMKLGAKDYIIKSNIDLEDLVIKVKDKYLANSI
jgi:DNA-binding response OmpR family regulator